MSAPGWHPDPAGSGQQRYFDGTQWTENYAPAAAPPPGVAPKRKRGMRRILLIAGGVLLAIILLGAIFGGGGDDKQSASGGGEPAPSSGQPAAPSNDSDSDVAAVGSAVRDGKFEFQVVNLTRSKTVSDPTGNPYMTATAQGEFIVLIVSVRNVGDEQQSYFGQNQKLFDAAGREYGVSSDADLYLNAGGNALGEINPGNSIEVKMAFDVPPGTQPAELELHDSAFSGGVKVRLA
ncbi:DUF4352 domain-containing protein [Mycobacterium sp. MYCO198283]|uniref:DUF4352 domain-containing protein n=1 Tax=Mycobacterium sp. MYCO198283 TaxID=2883505 RepID=UPI001E45F91F|nr:DUF4352 domain-containing protein [Mycobacterium sp. MYCO198283]MCG5431265.1 DUF4352 domain-containing protein [Mycobacterium sp. MYCO198283]